VYYMFYLNPLCLVDSFVIILYFNRGCCQVGMDNVSWLVINIPPPSFHNLLIKR